MTIMISDQLAQIDASLEKIGVVSQKIRQVSAENVVLRQEILELQQQLAMPESMPESMPEYHRRTPTILVAASRCDFFA